MVLGTNDDGNLSLPFCEREGIAHKKKHQKLKNKVNNDRERVILVIIQQLTVGVSHKASN